ncbi:MAG: hypothetical protein ACRD29_17540 [Acidimicrobiales bacterium]
MGKKLAIAGVGGFALFYVLSAPTDSAEMVRSLLDTLGTAIEQIIEFLRNLL